MNLPTPREIAAYYDGIGNTSPRMLPDIQGWGFAAPIFVELVEQIKPRVAIEVGSFKGGSAIRLANLMALTDIPERPIVICVDFWQDWLPATRKQLLPDTRWQDETPLYRQFLYNVQTAGCHDRIIPLRAHSKDAVAALVGMGVQADLIYIDAGHDYDSVFSDIHWYWKLLRPGGIMFGHDTAMPDVMRAVADFRIPFRVVGEHWIMEAK